jgi:3-methyladenine DNA glycosylase AlkD
MGAMKAEELLAELKQLGNPDRLAGLARYGIKADRAFGVPVPKIRELAKRTGKDHWLAEALWQSGVHEARMLASMVGEPEKVTKGQMERWMADVYSWDICDACCFELFDKTAYAYRKAEEWSRRPEEFVKRAGFAIMAGLAVHDKRAPDQAFLELLPHIEREAEDARNFVKKAVSWALRNIGKRNPSLNEAAIRTAERLASSDSRAAKWVASDALRELRSDKVRQRLASSLTKTQRTAS